MVIKPDELELMQKIVRGEEVDLEDVNDLAMMKRSKKKKRKKKSRLKRLILKEREERWLAAKADVDVIENGKGSFNDAREDTAEESPKADTAGIVLEKQLSTSGINLVEEANSADSDPAVAAAAAATDEHSNAAESADDNHGRLKVASEEKHDTKYPKIPNVRRVREYVDQEISKDLDQIVKSMLGKLIAYQNRARAENPTKAKTRRRLVFGLNEVRRAVKSGKAQAVIVATNIDEGKIEGGLDDRTREILETAKEKEILVVFSLRLRSLGKALGKISKVSCVAVLRADGAHEELKQIRVMVPPLRQAFRNLAAAAAAAPAFPGDMTKSDVSSGTDERMIVFDPSVPDFVPV
eukprot:g3822.t1